VVTHARTFEFADGDGYTVFVYVWAPDQPAKAVVQIAHGAAEHAARYRRVAEYLNDHGYAVYAPDHRGHGRTAGTIEAAGKAGDDGWNGIVRDFAQLTGLIEAENPGLPVFVLGHSMGSIVAQQYIEEYGSGIAGVILSGSWGTMGDTSGLTDAVDRAIAAQGEDGPSMEFLGMFGSFNERFEGRTAFDWLSRDDAEVDRYVDDPWSGSFAFSNGMVRDFFEGMEESWRPENEARIPRALPVLILSGDQDPAGGYAAGTQVLIDRYRALGLTDLTAKLYAGARHEILNETNRDEVQADILAWLDARVPAAG
jgi:alpha-beta hydrolase superfamily lysophospholipase